MMTEKAGKQIGKQPANKKEEGKDQGKRREISIVTAWVVPRTKGDQKGRGIHKVLIPKITTIEQAGTRIPCE